MAIRACAVLVVAGACDTKRGEYAGDGDTGRPAPAMVRDMSETPRAGDSTAGHSQRSGRPGIAGDSTGRSREKQTTGTPRRP